MSDPTTSAQYSLGDTSADGTEPGARCCCHLSPEEWRRCPLPQHDHTKWTEHGWNCPQSCDHPDAIAAQELKAARAACEAARWPEHHRDDCAWCAHVRSVRGPL